MKKFFTILKRETFREMRSWKIIVIAIVMLSIMLVTLPLLSYSVQSIQPSYGILSAPYNDSGYIDLKVMAIDSGGTPVSVTGNVTFQYGSNGTKVFISDFKTSTSSPIIVKTHIKFEIPLNGFFIFWISGVKYYSEIFSTISISISIHQIVSPSNSSLPGIALLVTSYNGTVPGNFSLYINGTYAGKPDSNGFMKAFGIGKVTFKYGNYSQMIWEIPKPEIYSSLTPEALISSFTSSIISLFVPIAAIIAGYDSLAKEKVSGALDLILSRPVKRETVYWGKVLGAFLSIFIYFVIISLVFPFAAALFNINVTPLEIVSLIAAISFLTFIFIILEGISGFFGKSVSTPLVWGIVIWIFFNMIYSIISLGVLYISQISLSSLNALKLANIIGLGNPINIAKYITYMGLPNPQVLVYGVSLLEVVLGSIAWIIFSVLLFIYLSRRFE
ncbi:MAG: ABC transporter permease subunit [Thermoplasmata archaeon]